MIRATLTGLAIVCVSPWAHAEEINVGASAPASSPDPTPSPIAGGVDRFKAPNNDEWLVVTTIVADPRYLNQDFVTSSHFKKEPNGAKWSPSPCKPV